MRQRLFKVMFEKFKTLAQNIKNMMKKPESEIFCMKKK